MIIIDNKNLKDYNTFGVNSVAKYFCEISKGEDLEDLILTDLYKKEKHIVLGGGSNTLLKTDFFDGIIIYSSIKGIEIVEENDEYTIVECGGGEVWNDLVDFAIERDLFGLENLTDIPGTVGAAPVQNIGAYGVEFKDLFHSLLALNLVSGEYEEFDLDSCQFGYRDSIFKKNPNYFILKVKIKLSKQGVFKTEYAGVQEKVDEIGKDNITPKIVSEIISKIREMKLPDTSILGNCGSFFKNAIVDQELFNQLENRYPKIPNYPINGQIKIPSGWLIETAGWKGKSADADRKTAGIYSENALVLVNLGDASGKELYDFSEKIICDVKNRFNITLEREVNIV